MRASMQPIVQTVRDGRRLTLREAEVDDAAAVLNHLAAVATETDYLTFGKRELEITLEEEEDYIDSYLESSCELMLVALFDARLVGVLTFAGSPRPRLRHTGELGLSVRKADWGQGVGGAMLDALVAWARATQVITKLNTRVRVDNDRALALHRGKGFVLEGTISRELQINGVYFSQHLLGLEL
jgi:RimJ/RimL family protein N-acetyltransferase